jgi:hypothetical protein
MRALLAVVILATGSIVAADPIKSDDGKIQVDAPKGWEKAKLEGVGKIQLKAMAKNASSTIISEAKIGLTFKTLADYIDFILKAEAKSSKLTDRKLTGPTKITVNGKPALVYELRGQLGAVNLVFVKTFVETPNRWNQVMQWTTPSHLDEAKPDFEAIAKSLHEN